MTVTIRPARLEDLPELVAIQRAAVEAIGDGAYSPIERAAWRDRPADDLRTLITSGRYRVAEEGGTLMGGAGWDAEADGADAMIRAVFVHPSAHGRGIGARLLRAIEADLTARGATRFAVPAALNAVGFYERLGYRGVARHSADLGGVHLPYERMLKDAA